MNKESKLTYIETLEKIKEYNSRAFELARNGQRNSPAHRSLVAKVGHLKRKAQECQKWANMIPM